MFRLQVGETICEEKVEKRRFQQFLHTFATSCREATSNNLLSPLESFLRAFSISRQFRAVFGHFSTLKTPLRYLRGVSCGAGKFMKPYIDITEDAKKDAIKLMEAAFRRK